MSNELPGEWSEVFGPRGVHSYRDMAAKAGIASGTAHRLVTGGPTSAATINKVADKILGGDRDTVRRLRGSGRRDYGDWSLPAEASLLNLQQREAIMTVIQAMLPAELGSGIVVPEDDDVTTDSADVAPRGRRGKRPRG